MRTFDVNFIPFPRLHFYGVHHGGFVNEGRNVGPCGNFKQVFEVMGDNKVGSMTGYDLDDGAFFSGAVYARGNIAEEVACERGFDALVVRCMLFFHSPLAPRLVLSGAFRGDAPRQPTNVPLLCFLHGDRALKL